MACRIHHVEQHRSVIRGIEAMTLISNHYFPRHSHDQLGIGVIAFGVQRSWSGVGQVEASPADVIMRSPGEMHDGVPLEGRVRGWRIMYFDPVLVGGEVEDDVAGRIEVTRPVARDPLLARNFARLFASLTTSQSDDLGREENLVRCLVCALRRHGVRRLSYNNGPSPPVAKAIQRLDFAPNESVSLSELAALAGVSRFQLLRGFVREIGTTPHAYLVQRRVCLAKQVLAAGETPAQAAIAAGFADQSHMTRAFVRHLGITPSRYRLAVA
jgi:AraC-like DNA-binding protein